MNETVQSLIDMISALTRRVAVLEQDKISYQMSHDIRDNVQKAVINGLQYIGNVSGVTPPINETIPSLLQFIFNGKIYNIPCNAFITSGAGAPTFDAPVGTLYCRTDASTTTTRLYINDSSGGWTSFTSLA